MTDNGLLIFARPDLEDDGDLLTIRHPDADRNGFTHHTCGMCGQGFSLGPIQATRGFAADPYAFAAAMHRDMSRACSDCR